MNKYVSPIIEIENVEVEDIMEVSLGENETGGLVGGGGFPSIKPKPNPGDGDDGGGSGNVDLPIVPTSLDQYYNV
jgi:hypothetical protein